MDTKKKMIAGGLALLVLVGVVAIVSTYQGANTRDRGLRTTAVPSSQTVAKERLVPETPDAVADDILKQASLDESSFESDSKDVESLLNEDRSTLDNFSNVYDAKEF